jgi:hypothetical protein
MKTRYGDVVLARWRWIFAGAAVFIGFTCTYFADMVAAELEFADTVARFQRLRPGFHDLDQLPAGM